jgi:O-antigen/teichoic acid export membrane protein
MIFIQRILSKYLKNSATAADRNRLVKGFVQSLIIQAVSVMLVFAGNYWLVHWFGAADYGVYVHVFNWVSIIAVLALGGQEDVVLSRLPRYRAEGQPLQIGALIRHANVRILITGLLVTAMFLAVITVFNIPTLSGHNALFLIAAPAIYLSAFITLNQMVLQALNHIRLSQVTERLLKPCLLIVFMGLASSLHLTNERYLVIIAVVNLVICALLLLFFVISTTSVYRTRKRVKYAGKDVNRQTVNFLFISLLQLLMGKVGMLLLPVFTTPQDVGVYNIVSRFADLVIYPSFLIHTVLPQLFAYHQQSDLAYRQSLFSESVWITTGATVPVVVGVVVLGKWLLGYFGAGFVAGYPTLVYLTAANLLFAAFGPCNTILMMQGKERYAGWLLFVNVVVLAVLSSVLIPLYGIAGAGLAMLICMMLYGMLLAFFAKRYAGVGLPFLPAAFRR